MMNNKIVFLSILKLGQFENIHSCVRKTIVLKCLDVYLYNISVRMQG